MSTSVQYLKGVGPVRARQLARLGIFTVTDLAHHYPRGYQKRNLVAINRLWGQPGEMVMVRGAIIDAPSERGNRNVKVLSATIADGTGHVRCTWFNQSYLKGKLRLGQKIMVAGKFTPQYRNIVVEEFSLDGELPEIQAQYNLTEGISNSVMAALIRRALEEYREEELFPLFFRERYALLHEKKALAEIHCPQSSETLKQARYTLKFRELFLYQLSFIYWRRLRRQVQTFALKPRPELLARLEATWGFKFTADQARATAEIQADLGQEQPMNRLLQGDVGSGKTAVAGHALFTCALNGYKAVLMAPTEVVASQHFSTLEPAARSLNVSLRLLTGSSKKREREELDEVLQDRGGLILVGTHAVFQDRVQIRDLALVVTDEQHRFGVGQRFSLAQKGDSPHVLVMSATPIPRTLAMSLYGDLDVSTLRTKPGGRKPVKTYVVHSSRRQKVLDFISREMVRGNVGYIICPLIEESDKVSALSLAEYQEILTRGLPDWCRYGVLHGRMSGAEKEAMVQSLKEGKIHLLLATTVVEVGVDVGNATFIVVENSERFGLAQLHQLRGRVGRRQNQGYCFLLTDGQETERLKILEESNDGMAVAMADLKLRGSGQFLGQRQHGLNEFRLADVLRDGQIAKVSRAAAQEVCSQLENEPDWRKVYDLVMTNIGNLKS
jgi:ATP-dependent DNA helicase RecG